MTLDCACCGLGIALPADAVEDQEFQCPECGATCVLYEGNEYMDEAPYFGSWKCKHGVDGDEECDSCRAEECAA